MKTAEATTSTTDHNAPQSNGNSPQSDFDDPDDQIDDPAIATEVACYSFPSPKSRPARTRSLTQLVDVSEVLYQRIMTSRLKAVALSSLARALCDVDKRIRAWKGLADPSPFVRDGLPQKRAKLGRQKVTDISSFAEATEATPAPDAGKRPTPAATKRATTTDDATTGETETR